jgi:hypothetical protein
MFFSLAELLLVNGVAEFDLISCKAGCTEVLRALVLDRVPFNGSGFGVLLKPEPDPNPMFATRNFSGKFPNFREILIFVFRT